MAKTYPKPDPKVPLLCEVVSQELIDKLSSLIEEPFPPNEIGSLDALIRSYFVTKHLVDGRTPHGNIVAALDLISAHARMLACTLRELDYLSRGCLFTAAMGQGEDGSTVYRRIDRLQQEAEEIADWSQEAVLEVPYKNTSLVALPWLIIGLAQLYERIGKIPKRAAWDAYRECWYGEFLEFCMTIIEHVDPQRINKAGMKDIIKKVLPV